MKVKILEGIKILLFIFVIINLISAGKSIRSFRETLEIMLTTDQTFPSSEYKVYKEFYNYRKYINPKMKIFVISNLSKRNHEQPFDSLARFALAPAELNLSKELPNVIPNNSLILIDKGFELKSKFNLKFLEESQYFKGYLYE